VYFDGVNRFYLANEHSDFKAHFATPPNAFDEFETFPLVRARTDAEKRLEAMNALERIIRDMRDSRIWRLTHPKWLARLRADRR
jgi:hypothetical protein